MQHGFRADIEGLRALAILPILVFHLNSSWLPSGFIGVDIFFVISGYLITQMIVTDGPAFRLREFYWRRFLRLFPALLTTIVGTIIAGWWILSPIDYKNAAVSALPSLIGLSNIYFYFGVDYFNDTEFVHPLLHTWSLGVEEQFYLVWPLFLLLVVGKGWRLVAILASLVAAVGFVMTLLMIPRDPDLTFYMMPFRSFEFAIGALAWSLSRYIHSQSRTSFLLGLGGIAAIIISLVVIDHQVPWPGVWALFVALATGALLIGGQHSVWEPCLATPPARFLGRISYSLYLVHWPLIVLYRNWSIIPPTPLELMGLAATTVFLGWALYVLVEKPFRLSRATSHTPEQLRDAEAQTWRDNLSARAQSIRRVRIPALIIVGIAAAISAATIAILDGIPSRIDRQRVQLLDRGLTYAGDLCSTKRARCQFGDQSAKDVVYVVGDSHALNLIYGLDKMFKAANIKGIALYDHGCLFLHGLNIIRKGARDEDCRQNVQATYAHLATNRAPIIFAGSWVGYRPLVAEYDVVTPLNLDAKAYGKRLETGFATSLDKLNAQDRNIVIVKQTYSTGIDMHRCLTRPASSTTDAKTLCRPQSRKTNDAQAQYVDVAIDEITARFTTVTSIDPRAAFCHSEPCTTGHEGDLYFRDLTHLTNSGSVFLVDAVGEALRDGLGIPKR